MTAALQQAANSGGSGSSRRVAAAAAAAASGPAAASSPTSSSSGAAAAPTFELACPICQTTQLKLQQVAGAPAGDLNCPRCRRTFAANATFADLTLTSGVEQKAYQQRLWRGTTTFQSPLVSFVYERGWRQGFAWAGEWPSAGIRGVAGGLVQGLRVLEGAGWGSAGDGPGRQIGRQLFKSVKVVVQHAHMSGRHFPAPAGFPGADKECGLPMDYLAPTPPPTLPHPISLFPVQASRGRTRSMSWPWTTCSRAMGRCWWT